MKFKIDFFILISLFVVLTLLSVSLNSAFFSVLNLLSQLIYSYYILYKINSKNVFLDIRFIFISIYILYSLFWPLANLFNIALIDLNIELSTTIFASAILGLNFSFLFFPIAFKAKYQEVCIVNRRNVLIFTLFLLFVLVTYLKIKGVLGNINNPEFSRRDFFETIDQLWILLNIAMAMTINFAFFTLRNKDNFFKFVFVLIVLLYVLLQLSLGNRRDFLPILIFVFLFSIYRSGRSIKVKHFLIVLILFLGSFVVTIFRDINTTTKSNNEVIKYVIASNEFIYPMQTLAYSIAKDYDFIYGYSYTILPFQIIIPRQFYYEKPNTLAQDFVNKTFGVGYMGFAYTPVTEAYMNFGYIGPFLMYFIFGVVLTKLVDFLNNQKHVFLYFVISSFVFDFSRGEFSSFVYMISFSIFVYLFLKTVVKLKFVYDKIDLR